MLVMGSGRNTSVLVDANILYSRTLRDWLALLYLDASSDMFEVKWTDDIMVEFQYNLRKKNPSWTMHRVVGFDDVWESTFGEDSRISATQSIPLATTRRGVMRMSIAPLSTAVSTSC
ncbi:hypothetical protein GS532_22210 [Rhodococcus hoagii]|nr:hypothetical protein [Prescottella equi]